MGFTNLQVTPFAGGGTMTGPLVINTTSTAITLQDGAGTVTIDATSGSVLNVGAGGGISLNNGVTAASTVTAQGQLTAQSTLMVSDAQNLVFGSSVSTVNTYILKSTTQTPDTTLIALGTLARSLVICENGDAGFDFAHAQQTNPTVFVHSANQSTTEWVSLTHNQTSGIIASGAGNIAITPATSLVQAGTADTSIVSFGGVGATHAALLGTAGGTPEMRLKGATATTPTSNVADGTFVGVGFNVAESATSGSAAVEMTRADGVKYGPGAGFVMTAGTLTGNTAGYVRTAWFKFAWTNAMIAALGAGTTKELAICTLPAKTIVKRVILVVNTAATHAGTLTASVGRTGAAYNDYLVAGSIKAAANTVYGDVQAEIGADLKGTGGVGLMDSLPSYTGTTLVNMQLISTVADVNTTTDSTGTVYIQVEILP